MSEQLKPCPFCQYTKVQMSHDIESGEVNGIYCLNCKALVKWPVTMKARETFGENEEKWANRWNRRQS